jgi:CBS-domain-containing membrane protein
MRALRIIKDHGIRRVPVVEKGKLLGIVAGRDPKEAHHPRPPPWMPMNSIMSSLRLRLKMSWLGIPLPLGQMNLWKGICSYAGK